MVNNKIEQELVNRYKYLHENKELVLSLCIDKGIRTEYYKNELSRLKKLLSDAKRLETKNEDLITLLNTCISNTEEALVMPKYYLMNNIPKEIVILFENFILGDDSIENTDLYSLIEGIKLDEHKLTGAYNKINGLIERRSENEFLRNQDCFTVWRILTYVRDKNISNKKVLDALDRYYNVERYITTGIDWNSGYCLLDEDVEKNEEYLNGACIDFVFNDVKTTTEYSGVVVANKENEFEKEDNYFSTSISVSLDEIDVNDIDLSLFILQLNNISMLEENKKRKLYLEIQNKSKGSNLQRTLKINN